MSERPLPAQVPGAWREVCLPASLCLSLPLSPSVSLPLDHSPCRPREGTVYPCEFSLPVPVPPSLSPALALLSICPWCSRFGIQTSDSTTSVGVSQRLALCVSVSRGLGVSPGSDDRTFIFCLGRGKVFESPGHQCLPVLALRAGCPALHPARSSQELGHL